MSNKIIGIYAIKNNTNNKLYIGQSQTLKRRISTHKNNLMKNKDSCIYLQRAWNQDGKEKFEFYIVEECAIELLDERETYWIKELHSHASENGYNISWGGDAPMRNRKHSDETKIKMSKNSPRYNLGRKMSDEQKKKLSEDRIGDKHWAWGTKHSPETIEKMKKNNVKTSLGKKATNETREKQSKASFGKNKLRKTSTSYKGVNFHKVSGKWRARIRENHKETYLGLYNSAIDAAIAYDKYVWKNYHNEEMLNFPENKNKYDD